jgi:chorismate mutase
MTERQDRLANEREEIASRIARFKATQEKFAREREEYAAATMESALNRPPRWPLQKTARTG